MPEANKRDHIFQAAVQLFLEKGLLATQTRDVTDRAGVGTGLLNHYFRWPELRAAVWSSIFEIVAQDLRQLDETAEDALERFFSNSFAEEARPFWRLWIEGEGLSGKDPLLAQAVLIARTNMRDRLTAILVDGAAHKKWSLQSPRLKAIQLETLRDGLAGLLLAADTEVDARVAEALIRDSFCERG
jgi:AcrR family transcriptional regulator